MISQWQKLANFEKLVAAWFFLDAVTHLTMELAYVVLALGPTAAGSRSFWGWIWSEYARADVRWSGRDSTILSIEIMTACIIGPLCFGCFLGYLNKTTWRHPLALAVSVAELYGGWMTFVPEWVSSTGALSKDWYHVLVYLFFFNMLWVFVPIVIIWDCFAAINAAMRTPKPRSSRKPSGGRGSSFSLCSTDGTGAPGTGAWAFVAINLALYIVLVPLVLLIAAVRDTHT